MDQTDQFYSKLRQLASDESSFEFETEMNNGLENGEKEKRVFRFRVTK